MRTTSKQVVWYKEDSSRPWQTMHFNLAVQSLISAQQMSVTVEMNVNFVSSGNYGRTLTAESNVVSRGNSIMVGEMAVTDDQGKLIAKGLGTCMVRSRE